ncbi:MAG: hypothetical protein ACRCVT_15545 [Leadbetterella sp.]
MQKNCYQTLSQLPVTLNGNVGNMHVCVTSQKEFVVIDAYSDKESLKGFSLIFHGPIPVAILENGERFSFEDKATRFETKADFLFKALKQYKVIN